jgi:hypothetical protein
MSGVFIDPAYWRKLLSAWRSLLPAFLVETQESISSPSCSVVMSSNDRKSSRCLARPSTNTASYPNVWERARNTAPSHDRNRELRTDRNAAALRMVTASDFTLAVDMSL